MGGAGASDARERPWPFSVVRASDADAFVDALGGDATRVLTRAEDVKKYSVDWMGKYVGASAVLGWWAAGRRRETKSWCRWSACEISSPSTKTRDARCARREWC